MSAAQGTSRAPVFLFNNYVSSRIHCPGQTEATRVCAGWLAWVESRRVIFRSSNMPGRREKQPMNLGCLAWVEPRKATGNSKIRGDK